MGSDIQRLVDIDREGEIYIYTMIIAMILYNAICWTMSFKTDSIKRAYILMYTCNNKRILDIIINGFYGFV